MFKAIPYLCTDRANEMLEFYQEHFGAVVKNKTMGNDEKFKGSAEEFQMPEEVAKDFVMNAEFELMGQTFMVSDSWGKKPVNNEGASICFTFDGKNEAEVEQAKAFYQKALDTDCEITMPLGETEWTNLYAMFNDPFGITWMISAY
ncbi:VOC family protein [Facklamia lactis]|uniref:VOC family protein n=1 Tax=Facklamia lactis TaxID=2749967 RepID=UPI0018CEA976|nr:glyoxalase/bleomycin resistance/extradiol dioxygenase family protein [Facklamia lactis]MBG9979413.1 glyoxalase/bleomycin resistance/extradiol dioxygenase family protein [Facklamia lactis]